MRKIIRAAVSGMLALSMLAGLSACGRGAAEESKESTAAAESTEETTTDASQESSSESAEEASSAAGKSTTVSYLAEYPETAKKVSSEDYILESGLFDNDTYEQDSAAWQEIRMQQVEQADGLSESLESFYENIVSGSLSETGGGNRICSPAGLYLSFAMVAEITDGNTRAELLKVLGAEDIADVRDISARLFFSNYIDNGEMVSTLANSLWLNAEIPVSEDELKLLLENYYADVYSGDPEDGAFVESFKDWLKLRTGGMLDGEVDKLEMSSDTAVTLATTVYFRAKWQYPFDSAATESGVFHGTKGDTTEDFLYQRTMDLYFYYDHFSAIRLPFSGGAYMWFILPDEGYTPEDIAADSQLSFLYDEDLYESEHVSSADIIMKIPKFDITTTTDEADVLKSLGVNDVFDMAASDFSPLFPDKKGFYLSSVQHTARVAIDEEGCTATAFTLETLMGAMAPEDTVEFTLDRPFMFAVTSPTGALLFAGNVNNCE